MRTHLIVLGGQKCGTTWLQHVLDSHDSFFCPIESQEVHFFDKEYSQPMSSYLAIYKDAPPDIVSVDVTPDYLNEPEACTRIREFESYSGWDLHFVVLLREPVARLFSAFQMRCRKIGRQDLRTALEADRQLVENGKYAKHLDRYLRYFSREKFTFIVHEERVRNERQSIETIFSNLNLSSPIKSPYFGKRINLGGSRRLSTVDALFRIGGRFLRAFGFRSVLHRLKSSSAYQVIAKTNQRAVHLTEKERRLLVKMKKEYKHDVEMLARLINRPDLIELWNYELCTDSDSQQIDI